MIDVVHQISSVDRHVGSRTLEAGEARTLTVSRVYETPPEDLWDACTNPERISRWFLPISGDLRPGGRYEFEGNASGTIERCEPPQQPGRNVGVRRPDLVGRAAPHARARRPHAVRARAHRPCRGRVLGPVRAGRRGRRLGRRPPRLEPVPDQPSRPARARRRRGLAAIRCRPPVQQPLQRALGRGQHRRRHRRSRGTGSRSAHDGVLQRPAGRVIRH